MKKILQNAKAQATTKTVNRRFIFEKLYTKFENFAEPFEPIDTITVPPKDLFGFLYHFSKPFKFLIITLGLLSATLGLIEAQLFELIGTIVDVLKENEYDQLWQNERGTFITALVLLVSMPIFQLLWSLIIRQSLNARWLNNMRWQAHNQLLGQSMSFYNNDFSGRISTKMLQTMVAIREFVVKLVDVFTYLSIFVISLLFIIGSLHSMLLVPFGLWVVCYISVLRYYLPKLNVTSAEVANANSFMTGRIVDSYTNMQTVKLFAHSRRERIYAREGLQQLLDAATPQLRYVTGLTTSVTVLNILLFGGLIALSVVSYGQGIISLGVVAVALAFAKRLSGISMWVMWELAALFQSLGTIYDGMEMLTKPIQVNDATNAKKLTVTQGAIQFNKLNFEYDGKTMFNNFNLDIKAGEKVGIVGRSGAGKSTLVNVLLRFYDLQNGSITIDGQCTHSVTQDSLRQSIGVVTQDTALLNRSIKDNILYGNPNATEQDLQRAIKQSKVSDFINDLVDNKGNTGLEALAGERGVKLSGGQRQRIAIARVLLKNAPILVLDEATSALDSEVELAITQSLDELMHGKTVIAIAHRLSTLSAMDRLIIMDAGTIVEQGTHDELLANNGLYAKLWHHQSGGFLDV